MLTRYNPIDIEYILRTENAPPPFPPASDRTAWQAVCDAIGKEAVSEIISQGETAAKAPIPSLPASLYLEFKRNGERGGYQEPRNIRRHNHTLLTLAECLEYKGRFLDPLMDLTWATCEESSWASPAHQGDLTDLDFPIVDLNASMTGTHLAEMDLLLGPDLDPMVGKRIRDEVNRRLFTPYLTRHDHWWMHNTWMRTTNNWSAVCNGNIVMTALYLEKDIPRLSEIIARATRSLDDYFRTYDESGGSSEGPGPWEFGFSNYTLMAQLLEHRTNGRLAFMAPEFIREIAKFPLQTVMAPGQWVNFADTESRTIFPDAFLIYTAERLNLPDLITLYHEQCQRENTTARASELPWMIRRLFWRSKDTPNKPVRFIPAKHDWYNGMHWMFARVNPANPDALVLAAKGGHNGEMHNQNDVGSFIFQVNGEQVIADIGRGRFTRFYFGAGRYEDISCQSIGHSCPVPNGHMQGALTQPERLPDGNWSGMTEDQRGESFRATLIEHKADDTIDQMKIEMKEAYPSDSDLQSLVRTIALHRDCSEGRVELVDEVTFNTAPGTYESVLTTFGDVDIQSGVVNIKAEKAGARVTYDPNTTHARVDLRKDVSLTSGVRDVKRVIFEWPEKQKSGVVKLEIEPVTF